MRTEIVIKFTEMEIPPRCRKSRPVIYTETLPIYIKEVSPRSVRKAFVVRQFNHETRDVVLYVGKLYRQYQQQASIGDHERPQWRNCKASEVNWQNMMTSYSYECKSRHEYLIEYIAPITARLIVVDGDLYERCYEPYYSVTCFGLGRNHGGTGFFVEWATKEKRKIYGWNALDHKAAIEGAVKVALERGDTDSEEYIRRSGNGSIEVLMPSAVRRKYYNPDTYCADGRKKEVFVEK